MKILIDLTSLSDNFSGIERYALNISKQMINQDDENNYVLVFKNKIHNEFEKFKFRKNIQFKTINGKNKLIFNQLILPYNLYKIKADKYLFLAFPSPILFLRKGIINTIHDLTCWDYPKTMKFLSKWYFRISISNAMKCSEKILTVSKFSKNRINKKFSSKKDIIVIYNGVSEVFENFIYDDKINKKVKEITGIDNKYIMALGTLEPRKNLKMLIEVYSELKKCGLINQKLVLVGRKGWKISSIISNIDEDIEKDIILTGFVDDEYLPYIYYNSDLFIFPSVYEGFGIPLLEAMAMKTPVLASNIKPFLEILGNDKYTFESNSKESLREKLVSMQVNDEEILYNYSRINLFNWDKEAKKVIDAL